MILSIFRFSRFLIFQVFDTFCKISQDAKFSRCAAIYHLKALFKPVLMVYGTCARKFCNFSKLSFKLTTFSLKVPHFHPVFHTTDVQKMAVFWQILVHNNPFNQVFSINYIYHCLIFIYHAKTTKKWEIEIFKFWRKGNWTPQFKLISHKLKDV